MNLSHNFRTKNNYLRFSFDAALVIVLCLVGYLYTSNIGEFLDIGLYDESVYLNRGVHIWDVFPDPQGAPIYAIWYFLLSLIQQDTLSLYYMNYKVMTTLLPVMFYIALRSYRVSWVLAFILSIGLLYSAANFPVWPKVSHFAIILLLFGFSIAALCSRKVNKAAVMLVTTLLVSYVRPEVFLSFVLLAALFSFLFFKTIRGAPVYGSTLLLVVLVLTAILVISLGTPMGSGGRSMVAFGQHYSLNWVRWNADKRDPWTSWGDIVESEFGEVSSPAQAVARNPSAVLRHVASNLMVLPSTIWSMFGNPHPPNSRLSLAIAVCLLLTGAFGAVSLRKQTPLRYMAQLSENWRSSYVTSISVVAIVLPGIISIIFIYPREHYVLIVGVFFVFLVAVLFGRQMSTDRHQLNYAAFVFACILPVLTARPAFDSRLEAPQPVLDTILFLRTWDLKMPVSLLEVDGGYAIYLNRNFVWKHRRVPVELDSKTTDVVVWSHRFGNQSNVLNSHEWKLFRSDPEAFGFVRLNIPNVQDRVLFVKREVYSTFR